VHAAIPSSATIGTGIRKQWAFSSQMIAGSLSGKPTFHPELDCDSVSRYLTDQVRLGAEVRSKAGYGTAI